MRFTTTYYTHGPNILDLYLGGDHFESRPGHLLSSLRFFVACLPRSRRLLCYYYCFLLNSSLFPTPHSSYNSGHIVWERRPQWPRGVMHESSSLARTPGSWVRIPLEAWMSVSVYSVFLLFCVGSGLAMG
jgi:hypothetical protein